MNTTYTGTNVGGVNERTERVVDRAAQRIPTGGYLLAAVGSILASAALYLSGRRTASLFVGLWAPTIFNAAVLNKVAKQGF
jgi:hypothetical protein